MESVYIPELLLYTWKCVRNIKLFCKQLRTHQLSTPGQLGPGVQLSGAQLATFSGPNCPLFRVGQLGPSAQLSGAQLSGAQLSGAQLSGAQLPRTIQIPHPLKRGCR